MLFRLKDAVLGGPPVGMHTGQRPVPPQKLEFDPCGVYHNGRFCIWVRSTIQMVDVHLPTRDGRWLVMPRYTQPEKDQQIVLDLLKMKLPTQPQPRIRAAQLP